MKWASPHALRLLTENEYSDILARASVLGLSPDYVRVNGKPYVVGKSTECHGLVTQRTGTARYSRDYYGILAAAALDRLYERGREVSISRMCLAG